jgi:hypothetical protein
MMPDAGARPADQKDRDGATMSERTNGAANNGHTNGQASDAPKPENGGREANGRFGYGNGGGPGNPFARQTALIRKAAAEAATPEKAKALMDALHESALKGDTAAARLWLAYSAGKPTASADPDALDAHELKLRREAVVTEEDIAAMFQKVPANLICTISACAPWEVEAQTRRGLLRARPRRMKRGGASAKTRRADAPPLASDGAGRGTERR